MKSSTQLRYKINEILASWNPLDVPERLAFFEYESYIDPIIALGANVEVLKDYLKYTITVTMGLDYKDTDKHHKADVEKIARAIITALAQ